MIINHLSGVNRAERRTGGRARVRVRLTGTDDAGAGAGVIRIWPIIYHSISLSVILFLQLVARSGHCEWVESPLPNLSE